MSTMTVVVARRRAGAGEPEAAVRRVRTTAEWLAHFRRNAARHRPIPWEGGAGVTAAELSAIARSLQA
jgi:hypothetical protein